ncbi:MAG: hypothetical protein KGI27_12585 [Thaumarchaeota archaeon]|nr:hypothetical protein [Nitrososphaerota archaeon]
MSSTLDFDELCHSILGINRNIQSVAVINKLGRAVEKINRAGNVKEISEEKNQMLFMQCILEISMGKDFDEEYGQVNYHLSGRENLTMLTFPISDHVVLVTSEKNISPISLARQITKAVSHCRKMMNVMVKQQG